MAFRPFDLTGKVALITGGNGGIGLGMAEGLAAAGSDVVIWGTNAKKNAAASQTLEAHGGRVAVAQVDVSNEAAVVAGIDDAVRQFGRFDFVAANAGVGKRSASFAAAALAMISELLENHAPMAAKWLPEEEAEAHRLLLQLRQAGLEIAALAQSALTLRAHA